MSGKHTYVVSYTITDAVARAKETAVLYWQFQGNQAPKMHIDVRVKTLARSRAQLQAWGHGVLEGELSNDGTDVLLHVRNNPAHNAVELRMLEPVAQFSGPRTGRDLKSAIQFAEANAVSDANAKRHDLQAKVHREHVIHVVAGIVSLILAIGGLLLVVPIFLKYGRELARPSDVPEYVRDPPDYPPAFAKAITKFGSIGDDSFTVTLVDLAQRGYLTITQNGKRDFTFDRTNKLPAIWRRSNAGLWTSCSRAARR